MLIRTHSTIFQRVSHTTTSIQCYKHRQQQHNCMKNNPHGGSTIASEYTKVFLPAVVSSANSLYRILLKRKRRTSARQSDQTKHIYYSCIKFFNQLTAKKTRKMFALHSTDGVVIYGAGNFHKYTDILCTVRS